MHIKFLFRYRLIIFMYNMFNKKENLLSELAIDRDFNTRPKIKYLRLSKIKTEEGRKLVFYSGDNLVSSQALDIINLPQKPSSGPWRLTYGKTHSLWRVCVYVRVSATRGRIYDIGLPQL